VKEKEVKSPQEARKRSLVFGQMHAWGRFIHAFPAKICRRIILYPWERERAPMRMSAGHISEIVDFLSRANFPFSFRVLFFVN
jgi:hypothetical protein